MEKQDSIYLSGGAFGIIYHIGVVSYLYKHLDIDYVKLYGNSAGAAALVLGMLYTGKENCEIFRSICEASSNTILDDPYKLESYQYTKHILSVCEKIERDFPNAYSMVSGKIHIGVTKQTGFEWISEFPSNEALFNALSCSCHVPLLSNYDAHIDGIKCIDGCAGFCYERDLPENTFIVSPINSKKAHLNGNMSNKSCLLGLSSYEIDRYYKTGRRDMKRYVTTGKLKQCQIYETTLDEFHIPTDIMKWLFQLAKQS
jgi:hypothetical protein